MNFRSDDIRVLDTLQGELILCPECHLVIGEFRSDSITGEPWPVDLKCRYEPGSPALCPGCGARWMRLVNSRDLCKGKVLSHWEWMFAKSAIGKKHSYAEVFIQSGNWRGWRPLTGE